MRSAARFLLLALWISASLGVNGQPDQVSAGAILKEINLARQNPSLYATFVEELRANFSGKICRIPGGVPLLTHEGVRALDEATAFLRREQPQAPLALSTGLCQAAADHCRDQASGLMGHRGSDRSDPGERISRYGIWRGAWAENIAYGQDSARAIVLALIIDDGVHGRGHRQNIFNPAYSVAGAAYGRHAKFGSICNIDFAGAYVDHAFVRARKADEKPL
jgi:uncharacterized protein YkwD